MPTVPGIGGEVMVPGLQGINYIHKVYCLFYKYVIFILKLFTIVMDKLIVIVSIHIRI